MESDRRHRPDVGNSPSEFTAEAVRGRRIVMTTTNGTRALRACAGARLVLVSSFLNLRSTAQFLKTSQPNDLLLVFARQPSWQSSIPVHPYHPWFKSGG